MNRFSLPLLFVLVLLTTAASLRDNAGAAGLGHPSTSAAPTSRLLQPAIPKFRIQEVATDLKVGYAVLLVDVDGDGKKDIVVVDTTRVVWYQNPTWKMRTILQGQTAPDNVCIDAYDIDGDGQIDFALGADWKPTNTKSGGTLQWLKRGKTLDEQWTLYPIDTEPTVHRVRFIDIDGNGKPALVLGPLQGRGATQAKNWTDGAPVRLLAYRIPKDPVRDRWPAEILTQTLHVLHNFCPIPAQGRKGMDLLCASYEGVTLLERGPAGTYRHAPWRRQPGQPQEQPRLQRDQNGPA